MTTREQVVAEARSWVGTPWQHQGHMKGVGTDCGGFIGGVAVALDLVPADWWEVEFQPHAGYARQPLGDGLVRVLDEFLWPLPPEDAQVGDVVVMRFRRDPQHLGIVVPHASGRGIVHALNQGPRAVVEHRMDERWAARITHAYELPGVH